MSAHPRFGRTRSGLEVHARTADHHPDGSAYQRFNKRVAVKVTDAVGSMTCAYVFACIALVSLPAAIESGSVIIIVSWVAQTLLQLVLLAVILVGQGVQSAASDARAAKTFEDVEQVIDLLDIHTEGGLQAVLNAVTTLRSDMVARPKRKAAP